MDGGAFLSTVGVGVATGLGIMVAITAVLLPISYVMNRYVYHHWAMRLLLAGLTVVALPIAWVALFFARGTHYFGLLPMWRSGEAAGSEPEGWFAGFWRFINILKHPFLQNMSAPDDQAGWEAAIEGLLVTDPKKQPVVPEALWEEARRVAVIQSQGAWQEARDALAGRLGEAAPTPPV